MSLIRTCTVIGLLCLAPAAAQAARTWTDSTGHFTLEADLVSMSEDKVVLQRADHELVSLPIKLLSTKDQEFLKSNEALELRKQKLDGPQTWTLQDGTKLVARAVSYTSRPLSIQRRRGHIFVNDRRFDNLPEFYQRLVPQIVAKLESLEASDRRAFEAWVLLQRGQERTFTLKGIAFETENGDEYAVPFFLLSPQDQEVLGAGFDDWLSSVRLDKQEELEDKAFMLQSLAAARNHDQKVMREIALLNLKLQAVNVGLTSLWEVTLYPSAAIGGPPVWTVVPGRDSNQASANALQQWPGYFLGPVRRLTR
ncbi:hypothetical protein ETAA8_05900 [Anatilimnocola aggregata]|uniref:SLA1 homology domain-containing protein n=1 Tax=Anatilimnocola aggregata TaxID=2528021 RepID=A0A517Y5K6_9BACT|nr:SHD1 domain-containing protein [Anatilimnocola aggregata]QDU25521.1 hypothetical protein ETAA8_05900 [Anatilimnocola aggregata]